MRYMPDTNICIYLLKRHPPQVLQRLEALRQGDVVMSVATWSPASGLLRGAGLPYTPKVLGLEADQVALLAAEFDADQVHRLAARRCPTR
jgi:predicted nucleic acid-binding protein